MPVLYELNVGCRWIWLGWYLFIQVEKIGGGEGSDDRGIDGIDGQIWQSWLRWWTGDKGGFFCCLSARRHQWFRWLETTNMFHDSLAFESAPEVLHSRKKKKSHLELTESWLGEIKFRNRFALWECAFFYYIFIAIIIFCDMSSLLNRAQQSQSEC